MSSRPHVDVILATNRSSPFLERTLTSLLAQTWRQWRLILVDDGSPDPSSLRREASRVDGAIVLRQAPRGVSAARNLGLRHATGELVAFLDDDDVWASEKLTLQVSTWMADTDAVAVYCAGHYIDADGRHFGTPWPATPGTRERFLGGEVPLPRIVTLLARRDATIAAGGFDEGLTLAEDTDYMIRLVQEGTFLALSDDLVAYRRHDQSMSATSPSLARNAGQRMLSNHIRSAVARGDDSTAQLLRRNLRGFHRSQTQASLDAAMGALRSRHWREGLSELGWPVLHQPLATIGALTARVRRRFS